MWANTLTSMKIQQSMRQLMRFIEFVVLFRESVDTDTFHEKQLPTVSKLILNLHELDNLCLLKSNEVNQKQSMKLIIINSTGRHRKAPSEFQSAKTIKRHEVADAQQQKLRQPSMDRTRRLTGAEPSRVMQRQERKSYREEDSLLMYDSNVAAAPARHNV